MGQCFPLPDDENVRETMLTHAENYEKIYNMYNFDVEVPFEPIPADLFHCLPNLKRSFTPAFDSSFKLKRIVACLCRTGFDI